MRLHFAKMHGLGNDFMVLDLVSQDYTLDGDDLAGRVRQWSDRRTGIGFDQLLVLEPPTHPETDFRYRIFNADGSEVAQCGNGARCVASLVNHLRLSPKDRLVFETNSGEIRARLLESDQVEVELGVPLWQPEQVPLDPAQALGGDDRLPAGAAVYRIDTPLGEQELTPINVGNPHGVLFVDNVAEADVQGIGQALVAHPFFPEGANIGFCQVVDGGFLRLRVFERGVGETQACGSGACAAVVAGRLHDRLNERVKVSLPGGKVRISWQGPGTAVKMTGPATLVFEGTIEV